MIIPRILLKEYTSSLKCINLNASLSFQMPGLDGQPKSGNKTRDRSVDGLHAPHGEY